jgi:serine/threonine protein kinase/WD40 repeat protein/tetratricopeptide (TPR) repeat protein
MTERGVEASIVDPLDLLAEEFVERLREGEHPSLSEFTARHPELDERIRTLFPALVEMEKAGSAAGPLAGPGRRAPPLAGRIGEFRILRKLGEGGMGVVYEAVQETLGRHVALKVLSNGKNATYLERFRREARTAARLHHTNIVPVFAVGEADGLNYYAMQFIHGQGLDAVLREVRSLRVPEPSPPPASSAVAATVAKSLHDGDFVLAVTAVEPAPQSVHSGSKSDLTARTELVYYREVARLGAQAAEALAYAHGQGVLHRDIKPSNLLLDTQGTLWITDFGLAKADDSDDLTRTGDLVGTLRYMAPERLRGRSDPRSDIYALGATLYELLALRPAFPYSDRLELLERISRELPPLPRGHEPRIPRDLETIVLKAMARDPADRYRSGAELAEDLHRFLSDRPIRARRTSLAEELWRWGRRNRLVASLAASVVMLLFVLTVVASLTALGMGRQRDQARRAEREKTRQLARSLLEQARAARFSRRAGQRFEALDAIRRATLLARQLTEPDSFFDELRTQAIACLALPDVRIGAGDAAFGALIPGFLAAAADTYVIFDHAGHLSVKRTEDDGEIARLPIGVVQPTVRLSGDGSVIAVRTDAGGFRVWDLRRGDRVAIWDELSGARAHDVRSDGAEVALWRDDGTIITHAIRSGGHSRQFAARGSPLGLVYARDGRRLAVVGERRVEIRDESTGELATELSQPAPITSISWAPDGRLLAVACGAQIVLWDVPSGREVHRLSTRDRQVMFAPKGDLLLSYGWSGVISFYDPNSGQLNLSFQATPSMALSGDGHLIVATPGRRVGPIELASGREYLTMDSPARADLDIDAIAVHPGGRLLAEATRADAVLWDLETGRRVGSLPCPCDRLAFDGAGDLIVHGRLGLFRWPCRTESDGDLIFGPPARIEAPESDGVRVVATSRDGGVIAGTFADGPAVLHRDRPARPIWLGRQWDVRYMAVSPDGRWVAASSWWTDQGTRIYDAATGQPVAGLPVGQSVATTFSPDGRFLLADAAGSTLNLMRVGTWKASGELSGMASAFTGDGRLLAVAGKDGAIRLVLPDSGRELARLAPPELDRVFWMAFTPDGSRLAVAYPMAKTTKVWNLREIRRQLADLGLDWDGPPYLINEKSRPPVSVRIMGAGQVHPAAELVGELMSTGKALCRDLADANAHFRLGRAFARRAAWGNATREFDRALALEPGHALAHLERGLVRSRVWLDFAKAAADFDRALDSEPDWHDVRLHRAHCRTKLGRWNEAAADADIVLVTQPWNLDARVIRGRALQRSGQHREALADFDAAATLYPYYLPLYELRSASLKALGDERGAAAVTARRAELLAGYPEHGNGQAWRLATGPAHERDPEGAYALARQTVEAFPRLSHFHNTLGVALYRLGRYREAQDQLRESLRLGPERDAAFNRYFLALCHRQQDQPVRAWTEFLRAIVSHGRNRSRLTPNERTELAAFFGEALSELVGTRRHRDR